MSARIVAIAMFAFCFAGAALPAAEVVPKTGRTLVVNNQSPACSDANPATEQQPLKTISAAAKLASPGDTVLVRAGIYRERVTPERGGAPGAPVTYAAAPGEKVVIKGSEVFSPQWVRSAENVYAGKLDPARFSGVNPFHRTISINAGDKSRAARPAEAGKPLEETLGQVFVDGEPYLQVMDEKTLAATAGSWLINAAGDTLLVHFRQPALPPQSRLVEISVRDRIFSPYRRGLQHITVRGFLMEHCANQGPFPQNGALSIRSGRNWIIEYNTVRFAKTCGIDVGSEYWDGEQIAAAAPTAPEDRKLIIGGNNLIRNNTVSDNGLCGIVGWNHQNTMIVGNRVERNNRLGFPHGKGWEEWAGIKLHGTNALIEGNLVRDNEAHGIWIDNNYSNAHITRNAVLNNLQSGIFLELGGGGVNCLIDNNVIGGTRSQGGFYNGNGLYTHDASNITAAHNLFIANAGFGVCMRVVSGRKFDGVLTGVFDEKILNNIFVGNNLGNISLPADSARSGNNFSDYNVFIAGWGGEGKCDFYINRFQAPFAWDALSTQLEEALRRDNVPEDRWPNLKSWRRYPLLNIDAWRALTGRDRHSLRASEAEGKTDIILRAGQPEVVFALTDAMRGMKCPPVVDADRDFYGNPLPDGGGLPGPFQKVGAEAQVLPLLNAVLDPAIRLTARQKEVKRQREHLSARMELIPAGGKQETYRITQPAAGLWLRCAQSADNPAPDAGYSEPKPNEGLRLSACASSKGPSHGPAQVLLFKVPADARYAYEVAAKLARRTAESAGYAAVELVVLDEKMANALSLSTTGLNVPGGFGAQTYLPALSLNGTVALKQGWHLALRLQVVSPGPAPAGYADLDVTAFALTSGQ